MRKKLWVRPVQAKPNRRAENGSRVIGRGPPHHQLGALGEQCKTLPSGVRGGAPENLDFRAFYDFKNHVRTVCQIMFFFDTAPMSQYVINEGADNKLNSIDSVLVDIE